MAFGIYVHIPYCIQRCKYCDFATYEKSRIMPPDQYVELLKEEILQRRDFFPPRALDTLYFGGGTPSLLTPRQLEDIILALNTEGFPITDSTEVTIEVNPGTLTPETLSGYQKVGFNRFSIGCQTLDDELLKKVGREHSADDTRRTLRLLQQEEVNYSVDLLFALPHQTTDILRSDLDQLLSFEPKHISPYCLTVPENHVLQANRPEDEIQVEMFQLIDLTLKAQHFLQYEISNYCLPGFSSRHNSLYWSDDSYWGIGLSSHSYSREPGWGVRFWNPKKIDVYADLIRSQKGSRYASAQDCLPHDHWEKLESWESLTDFFHTALRREEGVSLEAVEQKYGSLGKIDYEHAVQKLITRGLLEQSHPKKYRLSAEGKVLSNLVFQEFTFSSPN